MAEQRSSIMESNSFWSKDDSVSNTGRNNKAGTMGNSSQASVRNNSKGISKERRAIIKKVQSTDKKISQLRSTMQGSLQDRDKIEQVA